MNQSDSIAALAKALVAAQADIENASKKSTNPGLGNKYADLSSVREACHEPFWKHGLVIVQGCEETDDNRVHLTTRLLHESGEWIECKAVVPVGAPNKAQTPAQCVGSALTYARRYALAAMAGITQEDDDGNSAGSHAGQPPPTSPRKASAPSQTSVAQPAREAKQELTTGAWWRRVCAVDGLTEPDPEKPGKRKLTGEWFHLCNRYVLPRSWSKWETEEIARAFEIVALYEEKHKRPPDDSMPVDIDDPFADQGDPTDGTLPLEVTP